MKPLFSIKKIFNSFLFLFIFLIQPTAGFSARITKSVQTPLLPRTAQFFGEKLQDATTHWGSLFSGHQKKQAFIDSNVGKLSGRLDRAAIAPMINSHLDDPKFHALDHQLKKLYGALVYSLLTEDRHLPLRQRILATAMETLPNGSKPKLWFHMQDLQTDSRLEYHLYPWLQDLTLHGMFALGMGNDGRTLVRNAKGEVIGSPTWIMSGPKNQSKIKLASPIHQQDIRDNVNFEIGEWVGTAENGRWIGGQHSSSREVFLPGNTLQSYRDYLIASEVLVEADKLLTQKATVLKELLPEQVSLIDEVVTAQTRFKVPNPDKDFRLLYQAYESHFCGVNCIRGSRLAPLFATLEASKTTKGWPQAFSHMRNQEDRLGLPGLQGGNDYVLKQRLLLKENQKKFYQKYQQKIEEIHIRGQALQFTRLAENLPGPLQTAVRDVFKNEADLMAPSLLPEAKAQQAREFASVNPQELQKWLGKIQKTTPFPSTAEGMSQKQTYNAIQHLLQWQFPSTQWYYHKAHGIRSAL